MLVDNPILNSPFEEPTRYWAYEEGQLVLMEGHWLVGYYLQGLDTRPADGDAGGKVCPAGPGQHHTLPYRATLCRHDQEPCKPCCPRRAQVGAQHGVSA
jgi:hypothetical protein